MSATPVFHAFVNPHRMSDIDADRELRRCLGWTPTGRRCGRGSPRPSCYTCKWCQKHEAAIQDFMKPFRDRMAALEAERAELRRQLAEEGRSVLFVYGPGGYVEEEIELEVPDGAHDNILVHNADILKKKLGVKRKNISTFDGRRDYFSNRFPSVFHGRIAWNAGVKRHLFISTDSALSVLTNAEMAGYDSGGI